MRAKKEFNVKLGEQIKAAREGARLTQEQLSERIEVSPQYVSDLERGVVGISLPTLAKLCRSLGVSCDKLLFNETDTDRTVALADKCRQLSDEQFEILSRMIDCFIDGINSK